MNKDKGSQMPETSANDNNCDIIHNMIHHSFEINQGAPIHSAVV